METKFGWENLRKALIMIMGVLSWAIPQAIGLTSNPPALGTWKVVGTFIAVILILLGVLWHFMDLQKALDDRRPNIYVVNYPFINDINMDFNAHDDKGNILFVRAKANMSHIPFANNPRPITNDNNASSVRAEITYLLILA